MSDIIIEYIMDRKKMDSPGYAVINILNFFNMSLYERDCNSRIIREIGIDNHDIVLNPVDNQVYLTLGGINKCDMVLESYSNPEQMEQLLKYAEFREDYVAAINDMLDFFRDKTTRTLRELAKDFSAEEHKDLRSRALAEIRSRGIRNRIRLFFKKLIGSNGYKVCIRRINTDGNG